MMSKTTTVSATSVAILCHVVWGLQPVLTRYMQTRTKVGKMSVICVTQTLSCVALQSTCRGFQKTWTRRTLAVAVIFGIVTAARVITNFLSAGLTSSWHITAVATFGPFTTAGLARLLLGEKLDDRAWISLVVALCGGLLVSRGHSSQKSDLAGVLLQFLSMIFSGLARVMMKSTDGTFSSMGLMTIQYFFVIGTTFFATPAWHPWLHLPFHGWVVIMMLSICIHWAAAEAQVLLIRRLGPALYTSFQPLRLASTIVFGSIVLHEHIHGLLDWLGLAIVVSAVATFLARRVIWPKSDDDSKILVPPPDEVVEIRRKDYVLVPVVPPPTTTRKDGDDADPDDDAVTTSPVVVATAAGVSVDTLVMNPPSSEENSPCS